MVTELTWQQVRRTFDPGTLQIETTEQVEPAGGLIGQERAIAALTLGLNIDRPGFSMYVAGPPGTGKMTAVRSFIEEVARKRETPPDWCYVNNFEDPSQPHIIRMPRGKARELKDDTDGLIEHIRERLPRAFEGEEYVERRDGLVKEVGRRRSEILEHLGERANEQGLGLQPTPHGMLIIPLKDGQPIADQEFSALPEDEKKAIQDKRAEMEDEITATMKQLRQLEREAQEKLRQLDREVALYVVAGLIEDLKEKYCDLARVCEYLHAVQEDVVENLPNFRSAEETRQQGLPIPAPWLTELPFRRYRVNVLVDNSKLEGVPVVVELNPTYYNLLGRIEKEAQFGALYTDFTLIKPGSIHNANGGFLVIPAEDLLRNFLSYDGLKRALRSGEVRIEEPAERLGLMATKTLQPEPTPLSVKVVLLGSSYVYHLLYALDEEFPELFKVKADFDTRMERTEENIRAMLSFISALCAKETLAPLDSGAAAALLEHAARIAGDQERLSTRFRLLADVVREAHYYATHDGGGPIRAEHINRALDERVYRSNLIQERIEEMIARGTILIDTAGAVVGQVNGLSVIDVGDYAFGRPSRITATVGLGREGIVNIEREVELSGPIHSKGVLILGGYLTGRFAGDKPLSLAARLVFEQSYEGVEGDSASSAELYALLSALSGAAIRQSIAVTGSVNQHGVVQAIGGVNEKIEGYFRVCQAKGLSGEQGVMIPASNVPHLMLRGEVVEAIKQGRFHVWPVSTIGEGIEVLTGTLGGERDSEGHFPEGSIGYLVDQRLARFAESVKQFAQAGPAPTQEASK